MAQKNKNKYPDLKRNLRKEILDVFQKQPRTTLNHKQVAAALGIKDQGMRTLIFEILQLEVEKGNLREVERGKFALKQAALQTLTGRIEINRYGKGYVAVEGLERDLEIEKGDTGVALWGDTVEFTYNPKERRPRGRVIRVVERGRKQYVGILEKTRGQHFVIPSDQRLQVEFLIMREDLNGAEDGQKVVVEIAEWTDGRSHPKGRITKVLGNPGEHSTEMHAIIEEFGLPLEFPANVQAEAEKIPDAFTPQEIAKRRDFRGILTFTIDPFDAKDFDDALSYRELDNGVIEVGVHIADVSHYVQEKSLLDAEALNRATSVYLVDRTIPMLPEHLSNFLCSLRPDEDKLCFSAVFEIDNKGEIKKEWIGRTIIRSVRRFTYEEAQLVIETGKGDHAEAVLNLDKLAKTLRAKRFKAGSIDFDTEEVKFKLDEAGKPLGVYVKQMKDSNRLIEEFMLLANRRVAAFIGKPSSGAPRSFVYRIHDVPDPEKIAQLRTFLKHLGYKLPRPTDSENQNVIKELMQSVAGHAEEQIIKQMAIRSMAKAEYSTDNIGHYGLAFEYYTHFTSPIRRYPDVLVHRLLQLYLDGGKSVEARDLDFRCRHSSLMEKRAADAERASIKYKQVEYTLAHLGEEFDGIISGLTGWGMYVELVESKCEGMIAVQTLKDDFYEFDATRYVLRGARKRQEFHMGDPLRIRVAGGDLQKRVLEFDLVSRRVV